MSAAFSPLTEAETEAVSLSQPVMSTAPPVLSFTSRRLPAPRLNCLSPRPPSCAAASQRPAPSDSDSAPDAPVPTQPVSSTIAASNNFDLIFAFLLNVFSDPSRGPARSRKLPIRRLHTLYTARASFVAGKFSPAGPGAGEWVIFNVEQN